MRIAKLEQNEIHSALWKRLKAHMETEIEQHHKNLEKDADATKTAHIRGQISQLRALLRLGEKERFSDTEEPNY